MTSGFEPFTVSFYLSPSNETPEIRKYTKHARDCPRSFARLAASPLDVRARTLPQPNLKKKGDCSQSIPSLVICPLDKYYRPRPSTSDDNNNCKSTRISQKPNIISSSSSLSLLLLLLLLLSYIVFKRVITKTPLHGTQFDIVLGNHTLRTQPTVSVSCLQAANFNQLIFRLRRFS